MMKILQIIKIMERFLLLSFLILVLGFNSGCSNDGTNSTPSGAGGAGQAGGGGAGAPPILLAIVYVDGSASTTASEMTSDPPTSNEGTTNGESAPTPAAPEPDGTSWDKAYKTLQAGIDAAASKVSGNGYVRVHVAQGTYKPTSCPDQANGECAAGADSDREKHFALKNNVSVYGGYKKGDDGTYTVVEDATKDDDKTILSGDIGTKDVNTDNVYHVFYHPHTEATALTDKAKLENVTITKGNASETSGHRNGGGMYNDNSSPELTNVNFTSNIATNDGGGMYNRKGASPTLTDVTFKDNKARSGGGMTNHGAETKPILNAGTSFTNNIATMEGGGMLNKEGASPELTGVIFTKNKAPSGGGMTNYGAKTKPTLNADTSFSENEATTDDGGGMYNYAGASPTLAKVTFTLNIAVRLGGGMANSGSSPTLTDVTFKDNKATNGEGGGEGGGMYNLGTSNPSNPKLIRGKFEGNEASSGGGMANSDSSPTLENVNFTNNKATNGDGGGMYNIGTSNPKLTGGKFEGNEASISGGGMYNDGSSPTLKDVTFSRNIAGQNGGGMFNISNSSPTFTSVCTFTGNKATGNEATATDGKGGAIYDSNDSNPVNLENAQDGGGNTITSITDDNGKTNGYYKEPQS